MANSTTSVGLRRALETESPVAFGAYARLTQPTRRSCKGAESAGLFYLRQGIPGATQITHHLSDCPDYHKQAQVWQGRQKFTFQAALSAHLADHAVDQQAG